MAARLNPSHQPRRHLRSGKPKRSPPPPDATERLSYVWRAADLKRTVWPAPFGQPPSEGAGLFLAGRQLILSSGRLAMIDDGLSSQLVPWSPSVHPVTSRCDMAMRFRE
ncbi:hypothetical protein FJ981_05050 [Mesorhizobium sp. B1-1-4]|nr:hypothetical protein FJ981_05050 [Mesorhizobium sp. B1-1-4]